MRPTETQLDQLETALGRDLRAAVRALDSILLLEKAGESRRRGQYSDACAADEHRSCRGECDCECHTPWEGYAPNLPDNYQGIRNHPVGKTWHDHDATSDRALQHRASREWLDRFKRAQDDLAWLAQQALQLVGEPVEHCPAEWCGKPIAEHEPTRKAQGRTWHNRCYVRHRRTV
jgi:hypothetical protein